MYSVLAFVAGARLRSVAPCPVVPAHRRLGRPRAETFDDRQTLKREKFFLSSDGWTTGVKILTLR